MLYWMNPTQKGSSLRKMALFRVFTSNILRVNTWRGRVGQGSKSCEIEPRVGSVTPQGPWELRRPSQRGVLRAVMNLNNWYMCIKRNWVSLWMYLAPGGGRNSGCLRTTESICWQHFQLRQWVGHCGWMCAGLCFGGSQLLLYKKRT